jgi:hypothetical protein
VRSTRGSSSGATSRVQPRSHLAGPAAGPPRGSSRGATSRVQPPGQLGSGRGVTRTESPAARCRRTAASPWGSSRPDPRPVPRDPWGSGRYRSAARRASASTTRHDTTRLDSTRLDRACGRTERAAPGRHEEATSPEPDTARRSPAAGSRAVAAARVPPWCRGGRSRHPGRRQPAPVQPVQPWRAASAPS